LKTAIPNKQAPILEKARPPQVVVHPIVSDSSDLNQKRLLTPVSILGKIFFILCNTSQEYL